MEDFPYYSYNNHEKEKVSFNWKWKFFETNYYDTFFQLISASSDREIEVSVQLIDLKDVASASKTTTSSTETSFGETAPIPTVLEEQVLLLNDEAVFEFAPVRSKTNSRSLLIEVSANRKGL